MKNIGWIIGLIFIFGSFTIPQDTPTNDRFIEVIGSAEMEVIPDEIYFVIGLEEYWKEEFEKWKKESQYRTKIPLSEIETVLYQDLKELNISKDRMKLENVGNYWRQKTKDILMQKQLIIKLNSVEELEKIINNIQTRGINFMRIKDLNNTNLIQHRRDVKVEALKAAEEKANYLLLSVGEKPGKILHVYEVNPQLNFWNPQDMRSNSHLSSSGGESDMKTIKLRYEMKVRYQII